MKFFKITSILLFLILIYADNTFSAGYDTSLPCNTCHFDSKYEMHPINVSMAKSNLRTTLPLVNNTITCRTCHKEHTDDPMTRKQMHDTTDTYLLRIPNIPLSSLCVNCHDDKKFIIGTEHDMKLTAPNEKNALGKTTQKMGPCSACHLAHNGIEIKLWSKEVGIANDAISMLCTSCHNAKGNAKAKILNNFSHVIGSDLAQKGITTTLPLFDDQAKQSYEGKLTCASCHDVHQWAPDEKKQGIFKNEDGTNRTSFLRINNQRNSELCVNCHKTEGLIVGSPHDLVEMAFNEKNIKGQSAGDTGPCAVCHLVHNAKDKEIFSREYGAGEDIISKKCNSCHLPEKVAGKKLIGEISHPINISLASLKTNSSLPLFNIDGKKSAKGTVKCSTCHNVHQWSADRSKSNKVDQSNQQTKITLSMIQKAVIGKIVFIKEAQIYVDQENMNIKVQKDDILSVFRNGDIICKLKVTNYNPFAKQSEIFAVIISEDAIGKLLKDDIVFNAKLSDISIGGTIKGDGTNSFLNILNDKSQLCIECHKQNQSIINTKHDISINFPNHENDIQQKVNTSGTCSACHAVHSAKGVYLNSYEIKTLEAVDTVSKFCISCHVQGQLAANKPYKNHHPIKIFPSTALTLSPPPSFMPLYEMSGNIGFWDYVSCATCHDVHKWDPENEQNRNSLVTSNKDSFLKMNNAENELCNACHVVKLVLNTIKNEVKNVIKNDGINKQKEIKTETVILSKGGPQIQLSYPRNNLIFNIYEENVSGTIDDPTITRALVLVNGKPTIIAVSGGIFSEKVVFAEGKNTVRILATNSEGKSGTSDEIKLTVDTRKPRIVSYDYIKPVTLMDEFRIKIIFDQTMDNNTLPFIYFLTSNQKSIVPEMQISVTAKFYNRFEEIPNFDNVTLNEMKQGRIILNSEEYFGYGNLPKVAIKDSARNKQPGPGNDEVSITVTSPTETKGESYTIKESPTFEGIFIGEFEFGRWEEAGDKMIAVEDNDVFTVSYNLAEYLTTYQPNDTIYTTPLKITKEMKGQARIVIENAKGINGNVADKADKESFLINTELFYISNKNPITIQEGDITRLAKINIDILLDEATQMIISEDPEFKGSKWESFKSKKEFILSKQASMKTLYFKFKNKFNSESIVFTKKIKYVPIEYKIILDKNITKNTTLTKEMGPFLINSSLTIEPDATLTIKSGTKIWIDAGAKEKIKINVLGKLECYGEAGDEIFFTSNSVKPNAGDWEGIEFVSSTQNLFSYVFVEYANKAVIFSSSSGTIENSKFLHNTSSGIICNEKSHPILNYNEFQYSGIGIISINLSNPNVSNNYFIYNDIGILCENISSPKILNNIIVKNSQCGIKCIGMSSPSISDNNISQNVEYGIYIKEASPMIFQNNIVENMTGIYCEKYQIPFLIKNNNLFNNKEYSLKLFRYDHDLDISKNWWGVRNTDQIRKIIFDYYDDNTLGKANFTPILDGPSFTKNESVVIDKEKPKVITCDYQNPANITSNYQISFVFNESLNPYIIPQVKLIIKNKISKDNKTPEEIILETGRFSTIRTENDSYTTPPIALDESLTGQIDISIENAQDLTGNFLNKTIAGTFILDPRIKVKEGDFIFSPEITLLIKPNEAETFMIAENSSFKNKTWQQFQEEVKYVIEKEGEGKHTIFIQTRKKNGELSPTSRAVVILDKTSPRIINQIYNIPKINEFYNLKLIFSEPVNLLSKPKITLINSTKNKFQLPDGTLSTTTFMNDSYSTAPVLIPKEMEGYITILVENVKDIAGNTMDPTTMNNLFRYDIYPPSPLVKVEDGNYTQKQDIILLLEEQKDRLGIEMILSEDKNFKDTKWEELKKEKGFILSSGEGEKNIFIQFRDKIGYISEVQKITVFVDRTPPQIISYTYPKPANISDDFQIKIQFNESLDTTKLIELTMVSTGERSPEVPTRGNFITTKFPNDTFITPLTVMEEKMGGAITIVVGKAVDLSKNEMELAMRESFNFDTYAPVASEILVKEGNFIRNPKVTFSLSVVGAVKMIISEDINFNSAVWENYVSEKDYNLSPEDGVKKIYFKFEDENKNISNPKRAEIILDRIKPSITKFDFPEVVELNKPFKIKIHFNEEIKADKPAIVLMSTGHVNYLIANEGTFTRDKINNDTYITPEIIFDEEMKGGIVIVVDQVFDLTGNKMDFSYKLIFHVGEQDVNKKKVKIKEGEYVSSETITLLFNYTDVEKVKISYDKAHSTGTYLAYQDKIKYLLKKGEGEKYLFILLQHKDKSVEELELKVFLDKTPPQILKNIFPHEDPNLGGRIKLIFNESLDKNFPPSIVVTDNKGNSTFLSENGIFTTTYMENDTYLTPMVPNYNKLIRPIILSITKANDLAGNQIKLTHINKN